MIRVVVKTENYAASIHMGTEVCREMKTFDIDAPELENYLRFAGLTKDARKYEQRGVIGMELLPPAADAGEGREG